MYTKLKLELETLLKLEVHKSTVRARDYKARVTKTRVRARDSTAKVNQR